MLALYTVFGTTESKFVVYDIIGRNMFLELLVVGFYRVFGNDSNLLIVFYVQIMPDDFVMQLHRF
ncbi:beta-galactosidase [Escherichia coli]|nr:beta-galactosidase [Escherichia coli]SQZ93605.1 beta-galactosidase [Escherichia coli]